MAYISLFQCCNVFLINLCAKHLNGVAASDSFLSGLPWIIWHQHNDFIFNKVQWPVEKTRQVIWNALHDYGTIEWKRTLKDLEESPEVAYQDVLKEFDSTWRVENLIVYHSNLVVTWMDRPQMSIIS